MRICWSLLCWIAISVWCIPAGASAMANCHTHQRTVVDASVLQQPQLDVAPSINLLSTMLLQDAFWLGEHTFMVGALNLGSLQHLTNDLQADMNSHDCCDKSSDHHNCSDNCLNCEGCTTAHYVGMPAQGLTKNQFNQQRIQFSYYAYLSLQPVTQERPPKY